ncbi:MAG: phosphoribosyl-AMP cyclohydrolase [Candidatus Latescibacteria bacterium]|nr:phosphoribosyl-AMP cyclohydrolase [Candidatus Latescibacterota bacterium]
MKDTPEKARLEEGPDLLLDFDKLKKVAASGASVVPVAVQDAESREVLLVGYANDAAFNYTVEHGVAAFWSTSRNELWVKGATSGDTLEIVDIRVNCEQNSLLYLVRLRGHGSCHTKGSDGKTRLSCYYRSLKEGRLKFVERDSLR